MLVAALTGGEPAPTRSLPNPYKGLRAFDEADAADFFGRADLVDEILARLGRDDLRGRLVLVVGGSGTGKSSVVRAGLLPRVRRGDVPGSGQWFVTTMLPGSSPFKELAESLRRVAVTETAGLADELAERRRHRSGAAPARARRRSAAVGRRPVRGAVHPGERAGSAGVPRRRDARRLGARQPAAGGGHPARRLLRPAARRPTVRGGGQRGDGDDRRRCRRPSWKRRSSNPVERVGGRVERALVAELVSAVVDEPAALPSLQFALYELAERSPDKRLTLAAYRELGGVDGAIASRAELLYSSLDDDERAAVRRMFERLVVVGAEGEPTRRRAARAELVGLVADPTVDAAIDRWAQARLLTLDRHPQTRVPTVELAHEALLREWPRLRDWIAEDREAIVVLGHLRDAAASWERARPRPGGAVPGRPPRGRPRRRRTTAPRSCPNRSASSSTPAGSSATASSARRPSGSQRQARANRRLRIQLAAIAVALVVALVGGFVALDQRRDGREQASAGWRPPASSPPPPTPTSPTIPSAACCWRWPPSTRPGPATGRCCPRPRKRCTAP